MQQNRIEVKEIKKEPECTAIRSSSKVKKDINKVYHRIYKKYKALNKIKNFALGITISFLLAQHEWIIADDTLKYAVAITGWAVLIAVIINQIDKFIKDMIGDEL